MSAPKTIPSDCPNCGGERYWQRCGYKNGILQFKKECRECHRVSLAKQREKHGGAAARNKVWESKNRQKALAHRKVEYHLSVGNIVRRPCEICGDPNSQAHHKDYAVPLEITWLCPRHHAAMHHDGESEAA